MKIRTKRKQYKQGGFIFIIPSMITVGSGLLIVKKIRHNLIKELNTLSSKQVKQLLKKISPKKEYINKKSTIKYIESKLDVKDTKSKNIRDRTKHKLKIIKKQYKICKLYLHYIKEIKR